MRERKWKQLDVFHPSSFLIKLVKNKTIKWGQKLRSLQNLTVNKGLKISVLSATLQFFIFHYSQPQPVLIGKVCIYLTLDSSGIAYVLKQKIFKQNFNPQSFNPVIWDQNWRLVEVNAAFVFFMLFIHLESLFL